MMKKTLITLLSILLAVCCFSTVSFAADVSVMLDGESLVFEQPPVIVEGRTLVPLRAIFEALGASVEWDGDTKTVTSTLDDVTIKLTIGSNVLYKNGEGVELDVPAQIVGEGYTMVPARAIAESYGVKVDWDDATKTVILKSPAGAVLEYVNSFRDEFETENDEMSMTVSAEGCTVIMECTLKTISSDIVSPEMKEAISDMFSEYFDESLLKMLQSECPEIECLIINYYSADGVIISSTKLEETSSNEDSDEAEYEYANPSIIEYINSIEEGTLVETDEMRLSISAKGNSVVYDCVMKTVDEVTPEMKEDFEEAIDMYFNGLANLLNSECPEVESLIINYYSANEELIVSREFKVSETDGDSKEDAGKDETEAEDQEVNPAVLEYLNASKEETEIDDDEVKLTVSAKGSSVVYEVLLKNIDADDLTPAMEQYFYDMLDGFDEILIMMQNECPEVDSVIVNYYDQNGELVMSREFK